jgi:outer membrane protein assembly factor BamA
MIQHRSYIRGWVTIFSAFFLCAAYLCAAPAVLHASDAEEAYPDSTLRVSEIVFSGNDVTKEYVVEREMSLKPGAVITHDAVQYDIERIYSLQLFTKVNITVLPADSASARLLVTLNERWYFYPFPVVGLKDNNWHDIYYGLGVAHNNVGGRAVQAAIQCVFGYDPFIAVSFYNPAVSSDNSLFLSSRFSYSIQKNKSLVSQAGGVNFDEYRSDADVGLGRRISRFSAVSVDVEYFRLTVSDNKVGRTLSSDGTDQFVSVNTGYKYDTRDLAEYPSRGSLVRLGMSKSGFRGDVDYERFSFDYRRYIPTFFDVVITGRAFGNMAAGGRVPNYAHMYFGYGDRIRGHYNDILEGEQILGTSAELHIPLLSPRYYRVALMPIEQFRDIRYAFNLALFADAGTVWNRHDGPNIHSVSSGFGAGVHMLFAYSFVFRLEYAFREKFKGGEGIFNIGAAF